MLHPKGNANLRLDPPLRHAQAGFANVSYSFASISAMMVSYLQRLHWLGGALFVC